MEIRLFKEFLQLAKSLNFTVAADMLFMSRSTLSKHISQLEDELGVELFERSTKSVKLTKQGRILRERAYNIMREYEQAIIELDGSKTVSGTLRIAGCLRYPQINQVMMDTVSAFERKYRDVDITMEDIFGRDFRDQLMDGTLDVVCSFRLPSLNEEGLDFAPLFDMSLCAWVPQESPLASRTSVTYEELGNLVIRYLEPGASRLLTSFFRGIFEQRGLSPRVGKPLTPTFYMEADEFCLFPYAPAPVDALPKIVQVPIDEPGELSVCWVRKAKSVNPLPALFFEQARI